MVREALCRYERTLCWLAGAFFRSNRALFRLSRSLCCPEKGPLRLVKGPFRLTKALFLSKRALHRPVSVLFWHERPLSSFLPALAGLKCPCFGLKRPSFDQRKPSISLWGPLRWPEKGPFRPKRILYGRLRAILADKWHSVGLRGTCVGLEGSLSTREGSRRPEESSFGLTGFFSG